MKMDLKAGTYIFLVPAFFIYFYSESLLRQAAISNILPENVKMDSILEMLPANFREKADYSIQKGQITDSIKNAQTESERVASMCNLAEILTNDKEKEKLYKKILEEYPNSKESARAYIFFYRNPETDTKISTDEYRDFIMKFPQIDQFYMWSIGLAKLIKTKGTEEEQYNYLSPLLDVKPQYRDYSGLYNKIATLAGKLEKTGIYPKARKREEEALEHPFIETVFNKKLIEELNKEKKEKGN
jgi:tetratricopeptide (TPR) repeat protein